MGEMADLTIEQGMNEDDYYYDHPEEMDEVYSDESPAPHYNASKQFWLSTGKNSSKDKVCKYCNKSGFHWKMTKNGWRLFNEKNEPHNCRKNWNNKKWSKFKNDPLIGKALERFKKKLNNKYHV